MYTGWFSVTSLRSVSLRIFSNLYFTNDIATTVVSFM